MVSVSGSPVADLARVYDPNNKPGAREPDINELGILIGHRLLEVLSGSVTLQNRDEGGLRILDGVAGTAGEGLTERA